MMIYVDDERTAESISSRITDLWLKAKRAKVVNGDILSCASMDFVGRAIRIVLILHVLFFTDVDIIPWK